MDLRGIAGAAACWGLIAALGSAVVHADVDISEYESKTTLRDRKSREAYLREIAVAGWWAVALRMKQLNRAPVSWDELQVIVLHLAKSYPALGMDGAFEWSLVLAGFVSPLLLAALWCWIRKRPRI